MSLEEVPPSIHPADQAWFSMLLVNDPNTALVGSLRPARQHWFWAALRRPFERRAPLASDVCNGVEAKQEQRPRWAPWIAAGLLLGVGAGLVDVGPDRVRMATAEALAAFHGKRLASATLPLRPVPPPPLETNVGSSGTLDVPMPRSAAMASNDDVLPLATKPSEQALAVQQSASTASASAAKRKPTARHRRRPFKRELTGRLSSR